MAKSVTHEEPVFASRFKREASDPRRVPTSGQVRLDDGSAAVPRALLATERDSASLMLRLALSLVMFPHGAQHLLGWFGGYGFAGTYSWMTDTVGVPGILASAAIILEFFAPILLFFGLGGRVAAAALGVILTVAATTHFPNGFFMNWFGQNQGEGWEFHVLGVAMAVAIVLRGSGQLSLDRLVSHRGSRPCGRTGLRAPSAREP